MASLPKPAPTHTVPAHPGTVSRPDLRWFTPIAGVYVVLWSFWLHRGWVGVLLPDSAEYMEASHWAPWDKRLWTELRPPVYPMLIKLVGNDEARVVWLQIVLVALLWLLAAWLLREALDSTPARVAAVVVVLTFSLTEPLVAFTLTVLTESLSAALAAVLTALVMRAWRAPNRRSVGIAVAVGWLWVALRYTNAYELVYAGGLLCFAALLILWRGDDAARVKRAAATAGVGVVTAAAILLTYPSMSSGYWTGPFHDITIFRVLPDPEMKAFFVDHGLPQVDRLEQYRNLPLFSYNQQDINRDPTMKPYVDWVYSDGRATYAQWIGRHPAWAVTSPFDDLGETVGDHRLGAFALGKLDHVPDGMLGRVLFPGSKYVLVPGLVLVGAALWALRRRLDRRHGALAACCAIGIAQIWFSWLGDPNEIARHALSASTHARVAWLVLLVVCVERVLQLRAQGHGPASPTTDVSSSS